MFSLQNLDKITLRGRCRGDAPERHAALEKTQKDDGDITAWLLWFLDCLDRALSSTEETLASVLAKARFWESHRDLAVKIKANIRRTFIGEYLAFSPNLRNIMFSKHNNT